MHRNLLVSATLVLSALVGGCKPQITRESSAIGAAREAVAAAEATRDPLAAEAARVSPASPAVTISDDEIDSYIEWWRADNAFVRKHLREMDELTERLNRKYSLADLNKVQTDPDLLAMLDRQREERMEHQRNKPISREKAEGFDSVLAGLGGSGNRGGRTVYEINHHDRALRGARDKYGDTFVDKVLSREDDIAAAMNP